MSWRDRDYARVEPRFGPPRRGGLGLLRGRSIVTILIIINVAIYVLAHFNKSLLEFFFTFGSLEGAAVMRGQLWRLLTAQYLHANDFHIFVNMLGLHFLGRPLERMWSARRFFIIYTLCGLAGNVFYTILSSRGVISPTMPAVGASGCIYGLLGIVAVLFPHATVYIYFLFPIKIRTAALIFGGLAVFTVINRGSNYGGEACHLAGLVFGVWWALKGEAWWGRTEWRLPRRAARTVTPGKGAFAAKLAQRRDDEELIDRILKKVYDGGLHSLSEQEKRALQEATDRQRIRETEAGRVDRL